MISGIPTASDLHRTAINWMNLAWSSTIECLNEVREWREYQEEREANPVGLPSRVETLIKAQRFRITNAVSLLQQSLELFLKAKVAEVSPFFLISGDPRAWPKPDKNNVLDFSEFRTVDAVDLVKLVNTVSKEALPEKFVEQYNKLRIDRNKIVHLDTGNMVFESTVVLLQILGAHAALFPGQNWQRFRQENFTPKSTHEDDEYELDYSYDSYLTEIAIMLENLQPAQLKAFLGYTKGGRRVDCPNCENLTTKHYAGGRQYAQINKDKSIYCIACTTNFADMESLEKFREIV